MTKEPSIERTLGFTGTRNSVNFLQTTTIERVLRELTDSFEAIRHGCCVNADYVAASSAKKIGYTVIGHPPTNQSLMHPKCPNDILLPPKDYLDRNRDIVDGSSMLLAAPDSVGPILRSGTWMTIRYAKSKNLPILIVYSNGELSEENDGS